MAERASRRATRERRDELVALLQAGTHGVDALAERLGVSASTVRRDLGHLQQQGRIARTYGGALVREAFHERSFGESQRINQEAKAAIAARAVELIPPGASVFLDAGTTCLALARLVAQRGPMNVTTRGLEAALLLARAPEVEVVIIGGHVQPLSHGLVGPLASLALQRLGFDVAFLGSDAVHPSRGLGEPTVEETFVKEEVAARADQVVLLADSSKLDSTNAPAWFSPAPPWTMVTDAGISPDRLAACQAKGIEVLVAD